MAGVDTDSLAAGLARRVRGAVRFDAGSRALYAAGGSNYRQVPIGVVIPLDADDVVEAPFGADTSLAGQSTNVAVVIYFTHHLNGIIDLDVNTRQARVQPGLILDHLRDAAEHMDRRRRSGHRPGPRSRRRPGPPQSRHAHRPPLQPAQGAARIDPDAVPDEDWVEDLLPIERVEAGALWFEGGAGPLKVPKQASAIAQVGWSVTVVLARTQGVWHLLEVGNVYP